MGSSAGIDVDVDAWVGRREQSDDVLYPTPARALALTLDHQDADLGQGSRLPELWHWFYFLPLVRTSELGVDGHPHRGGFLPPIALERRMWAGGRLTFHRDLHLGDRVSRTSEIRSIETKQSRVGPMVLITVAHMVAGPEGVAVEEEQDIVYLPKPRAYAAPPPDPVGDDLAWTDEQQVGPVRLFRFSALTFNAHRIHYDLAYATQDEHYPDLVVHGPLQAVLIMDSVHRHHPRRRVARFSYRATRAIFSADRCLVSGRPSTDSGLEVVTTNGDGDIAMRAQITWVGGDDNGS